MTAPLCGTPHHRHPETVCTEPAGHYIRDRDPHAGPLILDGRQRGAAAWDEPAPAAARTVPSSTRRRRPLTERRRHVLALVANGHTNAQIGRALGIHERTVNRHLAEIFQALGARDRANAVAIALTIGELAAHHIHIPDQQKDTAA
ncbi:helix-turn-helix domain-containing protein [Streptomyces sp. bgisy154]|uniref:helix-turn-helix domain-containing protein n=1 Tax=Streptomyces sp. bgisy154 TaxID=3413794 RepID=UPI003D745707